MKNILIIALVCLVETGLAQVRMYGALRDIMHKGDASEKVKLNLMGPLNDLYALGAVAGLDGEILVLNGEIYVSKEWQDRLIIERSSDVGAAMLVTAEVAEWMPAIAGPVLANLEDLEDWIVTAAENAGVDVSKPFPFLISAQDCKVRWHVVGPSALQSHDHGSSSLSGEYSGRTKILGFFGPSNEGEFTHVDSKIHLHFISGQKDLSGHVDNVVLGSGFEFLLPRNFRK